jgi:hypothetical protein
MTTTSAPQFKVLHPDGRLEINPSEPQFRVLTSEAQIVGMQAGTGSGKTSIGAIWVKAEMEKKGPGDYLVAAPTFPLMEPRVIPELIELFVSQLGAFDYRPGYHRFESRAQKDGRPLYRLFLGSGNNPDSLESATYMAAWIDELAQSQFPRSSWEAIQRRVAYNSGRILFTTTLYDVGGWYKTEIYEPWVKGDKRFDIIEAPSTSNPTYPVERFEQARASLPYFKFAMFHLGKYEKPTGLIYDCFNEHSQVISRFDLKLAQYSEWARYTGHDFGPNNTAALWTAQDPATGFFYLYREYHAGGLSVGQHVAEWKSSSRGEEIRTRTGGSWQEEEARYAYTAAGWPILRPSIRDVEAGIDQVYSFIAKNQLFVFSDCHMFLNEILSYTRELDENYDATDKIHAKSRFHLMDALRYCFSGFSPERVGGDEYFVTSTGRDRRRIEAERESGGGSERFLTSTGGNWRPSDAVLSRRRR